MSCHTQISLGELMVQKRGSVNPSKFPDEDFELYSVPAYDSQKPERLRGADIGSTKKLVKPGDVLLSRIVPHIRRSWVVGNSNGPRQIGSGEWMIFNSKRAWPGYLRHLLVSDWFHPRLMQTVSGVGGSLLRARPTEVARIEIPLPHKNGKPDLDEQKRIAAILDKADAIRRKRQQALRLTDGFLRSVFLDMFGDPVTNPKGLPTAPLSHFGEIVTGNTPSRKEPENYGEHLEWIKSDNINTPSHFLSKATECLSEIGMSKARTVPPGSILVTCIAGSKDCIGNCAMSDRKVAFNQQINAIVPHEGTDLYFLYFQVLVAKILIQGASTQSMKGMVSKSAFSGVLFLKPDLDDQKQFAKIAFKVLRQINDQSSLSSNSEDLFSSLQQRAFKGEL